MLANTDERMRSAVEDFHTARQRAALEGILARLTGKSTDLLSFEEVYRKLRATGSADRGLREIPLSAIVGTVGRYADFTRTFLPRETISAQRWAGVMVAANGLVGLPPIEVYQIGAAYFVKDGHHRVSVARQLGATHIEAAVIEVRTLVPLSPDMRPEDLIIKAEQAEFLERTGLGAGGPPLDWSVSETGQYARLESHIEAHRYVLEAELGADVDFTTAAARWRDDVYWPVIQAIREQGLLRDFAGAGRTETDLYVWLVKHRLALAREVGWVVSPQAAASDLAAKFRPRVTMGDLGQRVLQAVVPDVLKTGPATGEWRATKLEARYSDRLFSDILVPVTGLESEWNGLEQALELAQREGARLHGLHIVPTEAQRTSEAAQAVCAEFGRRCAAAGLPANIVVEAGTVTHKICERALLNDLVVVRLAHPPGAQPLARLGSGFSALIQQCARPVLAVPAVVRAPERLLLAYDGSPKADEALFVAAYLAEQWELPLVVVCVLYNGQVDPKAVERAQAYLEWHEVAAEWQVLRDVPAAEVVLRTVADRKCDLIIMGGYGMAPVVAAVRGDSLVDTLLRAAPVPLLICR